MAGVTDSDWFRRGGQRELIVRAAVTENLSTVPTVVLERERQQESELYCCVWLMGANELSFFFFSNSNHLRT